MFSLAHGGLFTRPHRARPGDRILREHTERNLFDDKQYVYCSNNHDTEARSWYWSWFCHSGLGLVNFGLGLGLKNLVLFTSLVLLPGGLLWMPY